ncbi:MAG: DUF2334 domain-containing protein [SAR202 cluster bacterium]|nr:DUF2334 domain-containing protein [SAR202 cluster bacterium]
MDKLNVIVCVDDVRPEEGYGCPDDTQTHLLNELNKEYGVQFTLFAPTNYHSKYPLSENKEWVDFWKRKKWIELAAHGCYHDVFKYTRQQIGECEFYELNFEEAVDRVESMMTEWGLVDHTPRGFRFPGWQCTQDSANAVSSVFDYLAIHSNINNRIRFSGKAKTFRGDSSIADKSGVQIWNYGVVFQSHIAGKVNDNNWTDSNYENFRAILNALIKNYELNFLRYEELCEIF